MSMLERLFRFKGGIHPATHKAQSAQTPIQTAPLPAQLIVPLQIQHHPPARCMVSVGERVLKGQPIGAALGPLGTGIHAPTSGTVVAIEERPQANGTTAPCVVLASDGEEHWVDRAPFDYRTAGLAATVAYLRDAGIVGLGGAAFPSHGKLAQPVDLLILNGAECEPWLTCDDRLMRERADSIVGGGLILCALLNAPRLCIAVEDDKPEAQAALRAALNTQQAHASGVQMEVVSVPVRYPSGGVKQLIYILTGQAIPADRLPHQHGIQCFNVGTAYAIQRAITLGEPLLSRIVTLTGDVEAPGNYEVLIGTPIETLLPLVGPRPGLSHYIVGGPMMGSPLADARAPIAKTSNCLIAASPRLFPPAPPEQACIRCGACAEVCPVDLQPQSLYWFARAGQHQQAVAHHLFDCIECGCCAYVCPAHIPLVKYYRSAKSAARTHQTTQSAAETARERFEFRTWRLEREKQEKAERLAARTAEKRAEALAQAQREASAGTASATAEPTADAPDAKQALIAAALARAKAQKTETAADSPSTVRPANEAASLDTPAPAAAQDTDAVPDKQALIAAALARAREQAAARAAAASSSNDSPPSDSPPSA